MRFLVTLQKVSTNEDCEMRLFTFCFNRIGMSEADSDYCMTLTQTLEYCLGTFLI